ncbi:MAG: hypothetical protein KY456_07295 [Chloroflexi bacterium]|nr:hypothetical protein [Chloroflexota bacterium]
MDGSSFDRLVRLVTEEGSRRGLLKSAFAATIAGIGATALLSAEEAGAKSCKAKCNKKNGNKKAQCKKKCDNGQKVKCKSENASCSSPEGQTGECCASQNLVCDVPFGASNSDTKCCPGAGAFCTPSGTSGPKCCVGEGGEREYACQNNRCVRTV